MLHTAAAQSFPAAPDTTVANTIRAIIAATHHPSMKWPEFPYYRDEMEGLYRPLAFQLFWLVNGRPRPQIRDAVDILLDAEARGLDPEDYDASRLDAQARQLQAGATFSPENLALFDTHLSLALFRQISDVHIGKINPKNLKYGINIEADGILGKGTFTALNVSPARRCRQIEFAMERLRWLPYLRDGPFIFVIAFSKPWRANSPRAFF
jgi:murein L,D-transpeptidase YcbB/YkuD